MNAKDFNDWISRVSQLNQRQKSECLQQLEIDNSKAQNIPSVICDRDAESCPHCDCRELHRHGSASGLQRWKCVGCKKTFNSLTGTPLARLRNKEKWIDNAKAMIVGSTVRETAEKVGVHRNTAFRWRHRFLQDHSCAQCINLIGIAECDTTYFYRSQKGSRNLNRKPRKRGGDKVGPGKTKDLVPVITLRDRSGQGADRVALGSQMTSACDLFQKHLRKDTLVITDGCTELCAAAAVRDVNVHLSLPGLESRGLSGSPFNIQTVNAFHSDLKGWMARFKGVATKYLKNYIGWHRHKIEKTYGDAPEKFISLSFNPLGSFPQLTVT